jgi:hypothetical protein
MAHVLVTGGAGFIGSHLAEALLKRGDRVTVLDDLSTGSRENIYHLHDNPNFEFVLGTILDAGVVDGLVSQCQTVYHLAAAVGVKYIIENPLTSLRINIKGTENVFEAANRHKRKVMLASTSEIYGKNEKERLSENDDRILGSTSIPGVLVHKGRGRILRARLLEGKKAAGRHRSLLQHLRPAPDRRVRNGHPPLREGRPPPTPAARVRRRKTNPLLLLC